MQYRRLGDSDLVVSEISLGSWLTYSGGIDRTRAEACVAKAFDLGINFIDTANVYGRGASEFFLGDVLRSRARSSYILATKLYFPMTETDSGLSASQIYKQIDASLARLRMDYIDLYQCHRYDPKTPLEETMEALTRVVEQGKVRYLGFSEWTADQIRAAVEMPGVARFVSSQPQYSMIWREPEADVIDLCAANGIGQIVWSPLGQGVLTGKYLPGQPPPGDARATNPEMNVYFGDALRDDRLLAAVQELRPIAAGLGLSLAQLALAWVLRQPNVACAIIGASRPEQVTENAAASGVTLDAESLEAIDVVLVPAVAAVRSSQLAD